MIRFISNGLTDQFGRSNFVDDNAVCVGLKEYPDGTPLVWCTAEFDDGYSGEPHWSNYTSESQPSVANMVAELEDRKPLRTVLDGAKYHFGEVGIEQGNLWNRNIMFAKVQLLRDGIPDYEPKRGLVLYVVLSNSSDLYKTDFTMSVEDRRELFGGIEQIKSLAAKMRMDVNRVLSDLSKLEGMLEDAGKKS